MILITVGTEKFPFNRLMQWVDHLIQQQFIDPQQEPVIVQYGSCTLLPQGADHYQLLPEIDFKALLHQARLIISHCGEGNFDLLAQLQKPFVLVPRAQQFGEHVDDHQIELAQALAQRGVPVALTPGDLVRFLTNPITLTPQAPTQFYAQASHLLALVPPSPQRRSNPFHALGRRLQDLTRLLKPQTPRPA